ncbi:MAG: glycolate oxidase subunit GlcF [Pseudomonadota bacterium]
MQTHFTQDQLADPRTAEANDILRKCVHCGLCTATCPTYVLLGDERDSPRGRIYLIKDMFENGRPASEEVRHHVDRCLGCLSCMTTCPSGVDYMHLVDLAKIHIEETAPRTLKDRLIRNLLAKVVPYPGRFRAALFAGAAAKPFRGLFERIGLKPIAAMLSLAPNPFAGRRRKSFKEVLPSPTRRVALLKGCAQQVLRPDINEATERLLNRLGVAVVAPPEVGCCGALVQHMGRENEAKAQATRNVNAWWKEMEKDGGLDAVVVNASGCGTTVKDYAHMLAREGKNDPEFERKLIHLNARTKDITEFIAEQDLGAPKIFSSIRVAYHAACSMQHGQKITTLPKQLLTDAGFSVSAPLESHLCCGSAGVYNILQSDIATELRDRKVANIEMTRPDVIATGNIGCISQIQSGTDIPVVHTVELLDWVYGGPCPRGLEHLEPRVTVVPEGQDAEELLAAAE